MSIIQNLTPEIIELASRIKDSLEIDSNGVGSLPNAGELFAGSLPAGLTPELCEQAAQANQNWVGAVAAAFTESIGNEINDGTELGNTVTSFVYAGSVGGYQHNLAFTVGEDKSIAITGETTPLNDGTSALFESLAGQFASFVKGEAAE